MKKDVRKAKRREQQRANQMQEINDPYFIASKVDLINKLHNIIEGRKITAVVSILNFYLDEAKRTPEWRGQRSEIKAMCLYTPPKQVLNRLLGEAGELSQSKASLL